jgi:hypothetical protein
MMRAGRSPSGWVTQLEASGFEMDEADEVLRRKPQIPLHRTPGE